MSHIACKVSLLFNDRFVISYITVYISAAIGWSLNGWDGYMYFITKPKAKSGNYQRERPMLHMLKLKSPENAR